MYFYIYTSIYIQHYSNLYAIKKTKTQGPASIYKKEKKHAHKQKNTSK